MVGRLIQEQYVWFFQQKARQCQPGSLPSGKGRYLFPVAFLSKRHARKDTRDFTLIGITALLFIFFLKSIVLLQEDLIRDFLRFDLLQKPFHLLFHFREPIKDTVSFFDHSIF